LLCGPVMFAGLLALTDSYRTTFISFSVAVTLAGLILALSSRRKVCTV